MSQWWVRRSSSAVVILASPNTVGHSPKARFVVTMIEVRSYNPDITAERFPVDGTGKKMFRTKLFHFDRYISSEEVVAAIKDENFTPGNHVHGFAFGAAFPEQQRKHPIACLGSSAQVLGGRVVVYLDRVGDKRGLRLSNWNDGWNDGWRVLGVQDVSAA
jgi:hypothetical protein